MLLNQIKQVGMTYVTQRYLWWGLLFVGLIALPQLLAASVANRSPIDAAQPILMLVGMPLLFVCPFLVGQVKAQLGHPRARLTPHILPAHVIVLGGILLVLFVLCPLLFASVTPFETLGFIAMAVAIGVPAIWGAHLNRFTPILVSLVAFYSLLTNSGLRWWIVDASLHRTAHSLIVLAGAALIVAWIWRVTHLQEEMDDYQNNYLAIMARRSGTEAVEQRRIVATMISRNRFGSWVGDKWHDRLSGYFGGSQAGLVRLLRYGLTANPIEIQGLIFVAFILAFGVFLTQFSYLGKPGANMGAMFFFLQFAVLLPGQMSGEMLAQHRPRLAFEMLLPLSRTQLIDGLLAASARNSIVQWFMMNAGLALVFALTNEDFPIRAAFTYLLLSAATMFATMGLGLRTAVWPSRAKRFTVLCLSWIFFLGPMIAWWAVRDTTGDWPFAMAAAVIAAVGCGLYLEARRAWLNVEIG